MLALLGEISLLQKEMQKKKASVKEQAAEEANQMELAIGIIWQDFAKARQNAKPVMKTS